MGVQGAEPPGRGLWGVSPHETLKGDGCQPLQPRHEWDPKLWQTLSPRGWATGGPGGKAPWRGAVGGVPPQKQKRERAAHISNLATSGTQNPGKSLANEGGKTGGGGGGAPWQGVWGMCPQNFERGGELPPLAHPPRVGPKTLANHQPTGVGEPGVQGAKPPGGGPWGMCPHEAKRRGD